MTHHLAAKLEAFDPTLPLERAHTIPSSWYFDPELYALECRAVFGDTWQAVGRLAQVAEPGTFLTADVAGEPVLVVRDEQGVLRAFHNVCRHRAAQVINEPAGKATRLRCRYHGWTYDLAGRLRGTPEFDGVADFCRAEQGLVPLTVDVWGPLVWVHEGPVAPPLAEFLAPLPEECAGLGLETMRFVQHREYVVECNWKVFVDNFLDGGYHVNTVHPALAGALNYAQYRTHLYDQTSVQTAPLRAPADKTLAQVRAGSAAHYWWIFPNLMLNIYQDVMDTNLVLPLGPERCKVLIDFYFARAEGIEAADLIQQSIAVGHQIQMEDVAVCEEVQRGLKSRSFTTGRFSGRREAGGYHFHRLLAERLKAACARPRTA
jgi:choline monooxygenase